MEEVGEHWTLGAEDLAWLSRLPDAGKLGLALQLMYWRRNGRFPDDEADLAPAVVRHLAAQIGVGVEVLENYEWTERTGRRHRRLVLDRLAVASFDERAEARLRTWLSDDLLPREPTPPALEGEVNAWFARERVNRPGGYRLDRILRSVRSAHDDAALQRVADRLDAGMRERLDALLVDADEGTGFARLSAGSGPDRFGEPAGRDSQARTPARPRASARLAARRVPSGYECDIHIGVIHGFDRVGRRCGPWSFVARPPEKTQPFRQPFSCRPEIAASGTYTRNDGPSRSRLWQG